MQMVARTVLDTLRQVNENAPDVTTVFEIVGRLSQDVEPSVRAELMEQVPHIAMYCQELPETLHFAVPLHLLPLVVKFLTDTNNQVRKTSQAALLVLLEQGLVDRGDVEEQVCPVILRLTESDSMDDYRTEAVALLSKMAPLIGKEMAERLFLHRFASLCVDPLFHVRKVCAANFGDFSGVVGSDSTEQTLLPKFFYLCEDGVWGVRKACADVFMPVSCVCSPTVRQTELSPLFINLLRDQSRWVRMAAFQALGPFISTFADPAITALLHNENGEIVITDPDELAERLSSLEREKPPADTKEPAQTRDVSRHSNNSSQIDQKQIRNIDATNINNVNNNVVYMQTDEEDSWAAELITTSTISPEEQRAQKYLNNLDSCKSNFVYSSFLYWRDPVPELELVDVDLGTTNFEQSDQLESEESDQSIVEFSSKKADELSRQEKATETVESAMVQKKTEEETDNKVATTEIMENSNDNVSEDKIDITISKEEGDVSTTTESDAVAQKGLEGSKEAEASTSVNNDTSMWRSLPVITFQKFDDITGWNSFMKTNLFHLLTESNSWSFIIHSVIRYINIFCFDSSFV